MTTPSPGYSPDRNAGADRPWLILAAVLGAAAALRYLAIFLRYDAYGIAKYFMVDDAFYYFQIARNIVAGHGSTFDGVHVTNGYHPLWLLVAMVAYAVTGPSGSAPLLAIYGLQVALMLGAACFLYLALSRLHRLSAGFASVLLVASNHTRNILFNGMESTLAFFLISALFLLAMWRGRRFFVPAPVSYAWLVFILLLSLSLTRLEASLFPFLWMGGALIVQRKDHGPYQGRIVWIAVGLAAAAAIYVAVNLLLVEMPLPLSGLTKTAWRGWRLIGAVLLRQFEAFVGLIGPPPGRLWVVNAGLGILLAASMARLVLGLRRRDPARLAALAPFLWFAAAYIAVAATLLSGGFGWYKWAALLAGTISTCALIEWWIDGLHLPRWPALASLAAATALFAGVSWLPILNQRTLADWGPNRGLVMDYTIRFLREEIPPQDRIGAYSNGIFTYFSGRNTENLEGLVNGSAFYRARQRPATYAAYLRENRIRWIVLHTAYEGELGRWLNEFRGVCQIERVLSLDEFYHLGLRALHPTLSDPNVYILKLRNPSGRVQLSRGSNVRAR